MRVWDKSNVWKLGLFLTIGTYFLFLLPLCFVNNQNYSEMYTLSVDQPHIVQVFFDMVAGRPPAYSPYGLALTPIVWLAIAPIAFLFGLLNMPLPFEVYPTLLHIGQLLFGVGCLIFICLFVRRYTKGWGWALLSVALAANSYAFFYWSHILKPDIWMLFFVFLSCWYLDHANKDSLDGRLEDSKKYLMIAATAWGLAIGSKIWGIFLAPGALFSFWLFCRNSRWQLNKIITLFIQLVVLAAVSFFVAAPHFIIRFREVNGIFSWVNGHLNTLPTSLAIQLLFWQKIKLLTSWEYGGPWVFITFVGVVPWMIWTAIKNKTLGKVITGFPASLLIYVLTSFVYTMIFAKDSFNIYGGERNVLAIAIPATALISIGLFQLMNQKQKWQKLLGGFVVFALSVSLGLQDLTGYVLDWRPYPRVLHEDSLKLANQLLDRDEQVRLNSYFQSNKYKYVYILRTLDNQSEVDDFLRLMGKIDYYQKPEIRHETRSQIWKFAKRIWTSPEDPEFEVRRWFRSNAAPNSLILAEYYVNLMKSDCYTPTDDLPAGVKIQTVHWTKMVITEDEIAQLQPKYLVTKYKNLALALSEKDKRYQIVKNFDDKVLVLARGDQ